MKIQTANFTHSEGPWFSTEQAPFEAYRRLNRAATALIRVVAASLAGTKMMEHLGTRKASPELQRSPVIEGLGATTNGTNSICLKHDSDTTK
jgi:hypothetical protein